MEQPKRKFIIKKPRILRLKTPKEIFKHLFHGQVSFDFLTKYSVTETEEIDFNGSIGKKILTEGKELLKTILKEYSISNIHIKTIEQTPINTFGIINIDNIGNNKTIYFKHHTPNSYSLFYNIVASMNPSMLKSLNTEIYQSKIDTFNSSLIKDQEETIQFISNPIKEYTGISFNKIIQICALISKWLNKGIVLFQDSISGIAQQEVINCSDSSLNILNNDIIIIYVSYNKQFLFEPVININLDIKGKINYIINSTDNVLQNTYIDELFKKIHKAKSTVKVVIPKKKTFKIGKSKTKYIYFNPYDRNKQLPIIEINISESVKKTFLLGHEVNKYYNIYDDNGTTNDLAGRVKFNDNDTIDVDWCEGYPGK